MTAVFRHLDTRLPSSSWSLSIGLPRRECNKRIFTRPQTGGESLTVSGDLAICLSPFLFGGRAALFCRSGPLLSDFEKKETNTPGGHLSYWNHLSRPVESSMSLSVKTNRLSDETNPNEYRIKRRFRLKIRLSDFGFCSVFCQSCKSNNRFFSR